MSVNVGNFIALVSSASAQPFFVVVSPSWMRALGDLAQVADNDNKDNEADADKDDGVVVVVGARRGRKVCFTCWPSEAYFVA